MMSRVRCLLRPLCACVLAVLLAACSREQPPTGTVRVEMDDAVVNAAMLTHGYTWDGVASDPVAPTELADDDVPDIDVDGTVEVRTSFSQPATEIEVVRYADDGSLGGVECALEDGAATFDVEPAGATTSAPGLRTETRDTSLTPREPRERGPRWTSS